MIRFARLSLIAAALTAAAALGVSDLGAAKKEKPVVRDYSLVRAAPAPRTQEWDDAETKSAGCTSCHTASDAHTMHRSPAVVLGCTDCHGGNPRITRPTSAQQGGSAYVIAQNQAHVLPRYPGAWHFPSSANPARTYTLLNIEAPEFVRFVNPSDYRAVRDSCGACHIEIIEAAERSLMATGAMLWGGAAYNNGILPFKNYITGEAYTQSGESALIRSPLPPGGMTEEQRARGVLAELYPLPTWHVIPPADVFRVFERGGRNIGTQFPEIGLPNIGGIIQRLEEPGRPDLRQSSRGPGTGIRVAIPVLNIHKTRLNDPYMWFMGTNDQPGDYRHSGCAGCHVVYANDREPRHSMTYAGYGRDGQTVTADPTIAALQQGRESHGGGGGEEHGAAAAGQDAEAAGHEAPADANHATVGERGHPLRHVFTRAIPTSQCMTCHMHQPNIFLNSYLGYTMWDYESDADLMWPGPENRLPARNPGEETRFRTQAYPTAEEAFKVLDRNPEAAATRGLWADPEFLREVYDRVNPLARQTQFADYHGHGWNFRGIFRRDREGNLLDGNGRIVPADDPDTFRRANEGLFVPAGVNPGRSVHMMDIHAERGLQCADCHFAQDAHGNGFIYGEVANAVEIGCRDCHGTARDYANLRTSGPAAPPRGRNLETIRNEDGRRRFEWVTCERARLEVPAIECAGEQRILLQRSIVDPNLSWPVSQVRDSADRDLPLCHEQGDRPTDGPCFNLRSARSKLVARSGAETGRYLFGAGVPDSELAHPDSEMACFTCHLSWTTSCGGCHLPIEANWRTTTHHFEAEETRNFATYNPQVARDEIFQLGRHQTSKGNIIAPIRSTSALILSSTNINRERIYVQQPPISSAGYSSQAFAPHFPHTVRRTETKQCTDCHLSAANDNNAIMAQLMLHGTNFINFVGMHAWSGLENGFQATRVTEWDEPQAVIGSYLHRYAYPDYFRMHVDRNSRELLNWTRGRTFDRNASGETQALEEFANIVQGTSGAVRCLQNRGEYMFVAEGRGGFRVYDIASIGNKGFSERIVSAPVSPLGQDTRVRSRNATCMALPTNQPIAPERNRSMAETRRPGPNGTTVSLLEENQEQPFHPIYDYAVVTDAEEGLFLVDVDTLADGNALNNNLRRATLAGGGNAWNENGVLTGARHITLAGHYAYITAAAGLVVIDLDNPLAPRHLATLPLTDARASALQFRYLWVTDADGLKLFDVTDLGNPVPVPEATVPMQNAQRIYLARTYAYVAAKQQGLAIVNITNPERPQAPVFLTFDGRMNDVEDVVVASTNAALYAYVADGRNGLKVLQLTSFGNSNTVYGFSPRPQPELIAWARTPSPALSVAKGLDRDRGVDETGGQIAVFGRLGSRPFNRGEQQMLYLNSRCFPYMVSDSGDLADWVPLGAVVPNTPERAAGAICGTPGQPPVMRQAP